MKSKVIDTLSNVDLGYKRLWILVSIMWLLFSIYLFGFNAYMNQNNDRFQLCKNHGNTYTSINDIPFKILYECKFIKYARSKYARYSTIYYVVNGPRYITFGRLMLIIMPPALIPLFYLLYVWVRNGFNKEKNGEIDIF